MSRTAVVCCYLGDGGQRLEADSPMVRTACTRRADEDPSRPGRLVFYAYYPAHLAVLGALAFIA